jgi:signal transduction histidine kinase
MDKLPFPTRDYGKRILAPLGFYLLSFLIVFVIYGLYHINTAPALYALILCSFCGFLFLVIDALLFYRHYKNWYEILQQREPSALVSLKESKTMEGLLAQQLWLCFQREQQQTEQTEAELAKAKRYYTLWSHQIKTPLSAMTLLLQEEPLSRDAFYSELQKTSHYVDMALQYQRLNGEGHDLVIKEFPLEPLVKEAIQRVAPLFIQRGLSIQLLPIEGSIVSDEKWLLFVLEQLLTNAAKYTNQGGITIELSSDGVLCIRDTGIGIRADDLPRIWEWGYTGYNGRMQRYSTGIGLSLCKEALTMLGHRIEIESKVGVGSTVTLWLNQKRLDVRD